MKFSVASGLVLALATQSVVGQFAYNKWHETELERWLSDHEIPYPTPADRKDLENLVKTNWESAVASPYVNWDKQRLQKQLEAQGHSAQESAKKNKNQLVKEVQNAWIDTTSSANTAYENIREWIFDTWSDSQIKSFADAHGVSVPQPSKRDEALAALRKNYQQAARSAGETAQYPGNWLYASWSESQLKSWLDERGIPAPQPSSRDKLIASVRRNSRIGSLNVQAAASSAVSSAHAAKSSLSDSVLSSWSESQIKDWCDKNGIQVPQGSTLNELRAIARKHAAQLTGDNVSDQASAAFGAATSSAGNQYGQATASASAKANQLFDNLYSQGLYYANEVQIALGLKTNYASSASRSASSASVQATKSASSLKSKASKGEL